MRTEEINIYQFSELSESAKQNALTKLADINVGFDWWEFIIEDAKNVGIEITSFDLYHRDIEVKDLDIEYSCKEILKAHGENCGTYKVAALALKNHSVAEWRKERIEYFLQKLKDANPDFFEEWPEKEIERYNLWDSILDDVVKQIKELETEFTEDIEHVYLRYLENEYEYLTSKESIIETIEANKYEFTANGELY